jgi:hypothetical protein
MSDTQTLSEEVSRIESKAEQKRRTDNLEERVNRAHSSLDHINSELGDLADAVDALQFYREILLEAFDGTEPTVVRRALSDAESVTDRDREDLVVVLRDGSPEEFRMQVSETTDDVQAATRKLRDRLDDDHWSVWNQKIAKAEELQQILGGSNREFEKTLNWITQLVNQEMQNPAQSASTVVEQWTNARAQWKDHKDLQDITQFQDTHGISDDAVDTIRTLSQGSTTLDAVDVDVLRELKGISELAESISLDI